MSLSEHQIARYSRQILLKDVGGKGQRALAQATVALVGDGRALEIAGAYLAAGGTPVVGRPGPMPFTPASGPTAGELVASPARPSRLPAVVIGDGVVLSASSDACLACVQATAATFAAPPKTTQAASLGAHAALAWQHLSLRLVPGLVVRGHAPAGGSTSIAPTPCEKHRA